MYKPLLVLLGLLSVTPSLAAQREVVGLTNTTPYLLRQSIDGRNCAAKRCSATPHQSQVAAFAGGTAFDGRMNAVWISNGTRLDTMLQPGTSGTCRNVCRTQAVPQAPNLTKYTTGMAYLESGTLNANGGSGPYGKIYFSYDTPVIGWADVKGCSLVNYKYCRLGFIPATSRIGGLALDDINRLLFIGTYDTSGVAMVYVVNADTPCTVICSVPILLNPRTCPNTPALRSMAGLAYDACARMLYVTDGPQTVFGTFMAGAAGCRWAHRGCCKTPVELYTGLALLPPAEGTAGRSCIRASCNSCPSMAATTSGGAAVMGNPFYQLRLQNAPSNSGIAILALGLGGCVSPGLSFGFCNNIMVSFAAPGPFTLAFPTPPSSGPCGLNMSVPLPIPVNATLCNQQISFQWIVGCRPNGHGVTNCRDFRITAN